MASQSALADLSQVNAIIGNLAVAGYASFELTGLQLPAMYQARFLRTLGRELSWSTAGDMLEDAADRLEADARADDARAHGYSYAAEDEA